YYDDGRFEPPAMARLAEHLTTLLRTAAEEPGRRLGQWSLIGESERRQLLTAWQPGIAPGDHWQAMPAASGEATAPRPIYLLDRALEPVATGLRGAVLVAGDALPMGDRRGPCETAERFLPDPFSSTPGARMAYTGDLGRRTPEGGLELAGAIGRWVRIGERRIDLAVVEEALLRDPAVDDAAVIARQASSGPQLVAYVVPASGPWRP
ncbi:MAG: AMP-binding protein, partial [Acidobacteriota bacterium]|nr:AMP-binding protein [Acidobacteriota bacterium]